MTPDPKTQAWIRNSLEPTFGYPSFVRFSWATIKVVLEKDAHQVEWCVHPILFLRAIRLPNTDQTHRLDDGEATLQQAFVSGTGRDKDRCAVTKDLSLSSVCTL